MFVFVSQIRTTKTRNGLTLLNLSAITRSWTHDINYHPNTHTQTQTHKRDQLSAGTIAETTQLSGVTRC